MTSIRECKRLIREWCAKNGKPLVKSPCHVHVRSYVVSQPALGALLIAMPWQDAEPQVIESAKLFPTRMIHWFDPSIKAGDWCMTAYARTSSTGQIVAVPIPSPEKRTATKHQRS